MIAVRNRPYIENFSNMKVPKSFLLPIREYLEQQAQLYTYNAIYNYQNLIEGMNNDQILGLKGFKKAGMWGLNEVDVLTDYQDPDYFIKNTVVSRKDRNNNNNYKRKRVKQKEFKIVLNNNKEPTKKLKRALKKIKTIYSGKGGTKTRKKKVAKPVAIVSQPLVESQPVVQVKKTKIVATPLAPSGVQTRSKKAKNVVKQVVKKAAKKATRKKKTVLMPVPVIAPEEGRYSLRSRKGFKKLWEKK